MSAPAHVPSNTKHSPARALRLPLGPVHPRPRGLELHPRPHQFLIHGSCRPVPALHLPGHLFQARGARRGLRPPTVRGVQLLTQPRHLRTSTRKERCWRSDHTPLSPWPPRCPVGASQASANYQAVAAQLCSYPIHKATTMGTHCTQQQHRACSTNPRVQQPPRLSLRRPIIRALLQESPQPPLGLPQPLLHCCEGGARHGGVQLRLAVAEPSEELVPRPCDLVQAGAEDAGHLAELVLRSTWGTAVCCVA